MDQATEYGKMMALAPDSDLVKFIFKKQEGKFVRCLKPFLSKQSKVFEAMFHETWNVDTITLDDHVDFNEYDTFLKFTEILIGRMTLADIDVYESCCLYYYAEKYQFDDLKSKLIASPGQLASLFQLRQWLRIISRSNLMAMKEALDDKIKLDLNDDNALDFYYSCNLLEMKNLAAQAFDYITTMEYDSRWPSELLVRIAEKNRQELDQMKQMFDGERQVAKGCINLCGKRNRKNDCENCHSMWAKITKVD